jgi:hypothetical protein
MEEPISRKVKKVLEELENSIKKCELPDGYDPEGFTLESYLVEKFDEEGRRVDINVKIPLIQGADDHFLTIQHLAGWKDITVSYPVYSAEGEMAATVIAKELCLDRSDTVFRAKRVYIFFKPAE